LNTKLIRINAEKIQIKSAQTTRRDKLHANFKYNNFNGKRVAVNMYSTDLNHRRSSFSNCHFPTVEHSAAEHHVGAANDMFLENV